MRESFPRNPAEIAAKFARSARPLQLLGSGIGGVVFYSSELRSAIKVHHHVEGYRNEVEAYKRLADAKVVKVRGLTIPKMRSFDDGMWVIQMDFVVPPFLLDFAGALFRPLDFTADAMALWHEDLAHKFGRNVGIVYDAYYALEKLGIYYTDFRPSNIKLEGLPDFDPTPDETDDEL